MVATLSPYTAVRTRVSEDIAELKMRFRASWQPRYRQWMRAAFPAGLLTGGASGHASSNGYNGFSNAGVMSGLGTIFNADGATKLDDKRSRYFSHWIQQRGNALLTRRTASKTNIKPAIYAEDEEERDKGEGLIHFAIGQFNALDRQKVRGMGGFSWDYQMKQQSTWTGKTAFKVRVYLDRDGYAQVQAPFIDPFNLYHDIDTEDGEVHRVVSEFSVRWCDLDAQMQAWPMVKTDIMGMPQRPVDAKETDLVVISDYWRRDADGTLYHAMMINLQHGEKTDYYPVRESVQWTDHGYQSLPIVVMSRPEATHQFQDIQHGAFQTNDAQCFYHAEPFYAGAVDELQFMQGLEALAADGAALAALPIFLHRAEVGRPGIQKTDLKPFAFLEMATTEQLQVLQNVADGKATVDSAITRCERRLNDTFPDYLVSPNMPSGTSGFAFNSQISQSKMYMVPWTRMDEGAKTELVTKIIDQHRNCYPKASFLLKGVMPDGGSFRAKFTVADYPKEEFDVDIEEPAEVPGEEMQNLQMALQATAGANPLVSNWTARVRLGIGEPDKEQERIDDQMFHASPEAQNISKMEHFDEEATELEKQAKKSPLDEIKARVYRARTSAIEQQLLGAPQTGQTDAAEPGNPSPGALPPEAGVENPNLMALAQGQQKTVSAGRPRPKGVR